MRIQNTSPLAQDHAVKQHSPLTNWGPGRRLSGLGLGVGLLFSLGLQGCGPQEPCADDACAEIGSGKQALAFPEPVVTGGRAIFKGAGDAGSLGLVVRDAINGRPMLLSNAHVLSDSDVHPPAVGDPVYNTATFNLIGTVDRWVFDTSGDMGVATMFPGLSYPNVEDGKILGIGSIAGVGEPSVGAIVNFFDISDKVVKQCKIRSVTSTQMILDALSGTVPCVHDGNSGSVLVDAVTRQAVGLVYAEVFVDNARRGAALRLPYVLSRLSVKYIDPDVAPMPFFRYRTPTGTYFYTHAWAEFGPGVAGKATLEGPQCAIFRNPTAGAVPMYRYFKASLNAHFYTLSRAEGDGMAGYGYEGIAGYVPGGAQPGTVPLYRSRRTSDGTYLYTTSATERSAPGFVYEGIMANVFPSF